MKKNVVFATVASTIVAFFLGWLIMGVLLANFYSSNAGTATGVMKEVPEMWALIVSNLVFCLLLVLIFDRMGVNDLMSGAIAGAWISFLFMLCVDLSFYAMTNIQNLTITFVDPFVQGALGALVGGVAGWVLGKFKEA